MKFAIIITSYADSTLGLMRALCEEGHDVDLYYLKMDSPNFVQTTALEFVVPGHIPGKVYEIDYKKVRGAQFIKDFQNSHLFYAQAFREFVRLPKPIPTLMAYINRIFIKEISRQLESRKYELVEIISPLQSAFIFDRYITTCPLIHSFHEIFNDHFEKRKLLPELLELLNNKKVVRVFSENSKEEIVSRYPEYQNQVKVIPFGLYYNYKEFGHIEMPIIESLESFILHFGFIVPYKGIDFLYEAVQILANRGINIKVVIAGNGSLPILEKIKSDSHFILIQKFLTNDEITYLISKSTYVVCPYLSASQSGIPQTSYVFKKPLIATNVGAFNSLVLNDINGLLIPPSDPLALANAIEKLYVNKGLVEKFSQRLDKIEQEVPFYSWSSICSKYISLARQLNN